MYIETANIPAMKKIVTYCLLSSLAFASVAQMGSLAFSLGLPQNEFRQNTDATGAGADLSVAFPFQKGFPLYMGIDLNYMVYGRNADNEDLSANIVTLQGVSLGTLEVPLRIVNTNSIFGAHTFMRAVAPLSNVQPYAEALIGFRYISTNVRITDRSEDNRFTDENDDTIVRKTILGDWVFSYGYGGGFMFKVGPKVFLDLRVNYFKGQKAEFFDGTDTESWSVEFTGTPAAYDPANLDGDDLNFETVPRESTTDLLVIKFGVTGKF